MQHKCELYLQKSKKVWFNIIKKERKKEINVKQNWFSQVLEWSWFRTWSQSSGITSCTCDGSQLLTQNKSGLNPEVKSPMKSVFPAWWPVISLLNFFSTNLSHSSVLQIPAGSRSWRSPTGSRRSLRSDTGYCCRNVSWQNILGGRESKSRICLISPASLFHHRGKKIRRQSSIHRRYGNHFLPSLPSSCAHYSHS